MNQQHIKKAHERKALESLRTVYHAFPPGEVTESESPDFLITSESRTVGIEVTDYFRPGDVDGSPLQAQESLHHRVTSFATEECRRRGLTGLLASIDFNRAVRLGSKEVSAVAAAVANEIATRTGRTTWSTAIENDGQLPACVDRILVYPLPAHKGAYVTHMAAEWVVPLSIDQLRDRISEKEKS